MEVGQIVAAVCAIYGWTHEYVLYRLSWPQVLMFHRHGLRYDLLRRGVRLPQEGEDGAPVPAGDDPDVDAIEARYGQKIKRGAL